MKKQISLILIFTSFISLLIFIRESKNKDFCKMLEAEVSKNLFNRNKKFIPSWVKPFINEELLVRDVVSKTLMKEIKIEDSIIFSQAKCLFLFTLEEFNNEYISKKYEEIVIDEFNKSIKNFSF
tara:strand:+ start:209 stop:580 length:372 start_codon:yes stop_codon:yes gene_type:complete